MSLARDGMPWHPDLRRDLVPGASARFWGQVHRAAITAMALLTFAALLSVVPALGSPTYIAVVLPAWAVSAVLVGTRFGGPLTMIEAHRLRAEATAGYTTKVGIERADEALVELDVVDPRSGRVLRLAGERMPRAFFNDRAAFMRDRLRRVRAAAETGAA